jgi:hypothetical protein
VSRREPPRASTTARADAGRAARREGIERDRVGALGALEGDRARAQAGRQQQADADLAAAQVALDDARKQWQAALDEAAGPRAAAGGPKPLERAKAELPSLNELESLAQRKISTQGTFNAAAASGLGGAAFQERTAKATEQTAANTKRLVQGQAGGLVFG